MPICAKCGAELAEDVKVCPTCEAELEEQERKEVAEAPVQTSLEHKKIYSILAYMGFLVFIPMFAAKDSKFVRFHLNQGLVLLGCEIIAAILSVLLWLIPSVGLLLSLLIGLPLYLVTVVFMVLGIINAYSGIVKPLPLIGEIELIK